ncbi:MAG: hypothetical protein QOG87_1681 [Actinomycetota bacterium]|jgi:DNA-binding GntR family transcriptional regulator
MPRPRASIRPPSPYDRIKKAILDGNFPPGAPLAESALGDWLGVSRTPVREALSRLEQDGLVRRTDRGVAVTERTPEEILDICETRIALETAAARMAALRRTPLDRVRLERLLAALEEVSEPDPQDMSNRNSEFHRGIWLATHNLALIDLLDRLNLHLLRYPVSTPTASAHWSHSVEEHRALAAAVLDGDAPRAAAAAERHFSEARDLRLSVWEAG